MARSGSWRTRFGFYLLAIGSAFSLGNLWRFPFVVGENGGGAFVLLYVFLCLFIGLPILICELILGRTSRSSVMTAMLKLSQKENIKFRHWIKWTGRFSVILSLVILSYYSVISGWVLHYLTRFLIISFETNPELLSPQTLLDNGWLQFLLCSVHILIAIFVLIKGINEGLEKWISYVMPLFAVLVVILVIRTMSLPSNTDVLRFLFYPDFSKLTYSSLQHALGHVFFTLSVGFGTMVTFGSYMVPEEHIPTAGFRVTVVDAVVSLVALLLIFPVAFQASGAPVTDPILLFDVIPRFLIEMRWGQMFGFIFFLCLYFAALNATLGLFEALVANVGDVFKNMGRTRATWLSGILVLLLSIGPSLLSNYFESVFQGKSLIEVMDSFLINWVLPIVVLGISLTFSFAVSTEIKEQNFKDEKKAVSLSMYSHWIFILKYIVPLTIGAGLVLKIIGVALKIHS